MPHDRKMAALARAPRARVAEWATRPPTLGEAGVFAHCVEDLAARGLAPRGAGGWLSAWPGLGDDVILENLRAAITGTDADVVGISRVAETAARCGRLHSVLLSFLLVADTGFETDPGEGTALNARIASAPNHPLAPVAAAKLSAFARAAQGRQLTIAIGTEIVLLFAPSHAHDARRERAARVLEQAVAAIFLLWLACMEGDVPHICPRPEPWK